MNIGHIGKGCPISGDGRKSIKKRTNKRRRRLGKKLLDDTPKIVTSGWAD